MSSPDEHWHDAIEREGRACERGDVCVVCRQPDHDCACQKVARLWPRLVPDAPVAERPSSRERREHATGGRVLSFPQKTTASGLNPEAA